MAAFYDRYGEAEWDRHERSAAHRVAFAVHCAFLRDHVRPGDLVLEAGAGAGPFTIELARFGARVHVGDLSPVQVELNRQHVDDAGASSSVVGRDVLDICDLSGFEDGTFDHHADLPPWSDGRRTPIRSRAQRAHLHDG
jgi:2-polyprenyl-3-methyl-5-hydroxy-6-metoxy-1,4-benzoquinol methylase